MVLQKVFRAWFERIKALHTHSNRKCVFSLDIEPDALLIGPKGVNEMKIAVLGGLGLQGRAALADLAASPEVTAIICGDLDVSGIKEKTAFFDTAKMSPVTVDAASMNELVGLFQDGVDVAIDLLPRHFMENVCRAAIDTGTGVVNTNYTAAIAGLSSRAAAAGVTIMPECGLDPGIDLVIYGDALQRFDEIRVINSYCGGFPDKSACDNPLNYKISWTWEGVLSSTRRDARMIKNGRVVNIPAEKQHAPERVHQIDFPGLGVLEAIPNGDAIKFTDLLGVTGSIKESGRFSLRWPGWSAFWHSLKQLGFLSDEPVAGLDCDVSPYRFMDKLLDPQLQYRDDEKDLVAMVNVFEGFSGDQYIRRTVRLLIERDLDTGLMAMSKGVGIPASIVGQMIAKGEISQPGILSPVAHVPGHLFFKQLTKRGIVLDEEETILSR